MKKTPKAATPKAPHTALANYEAPLLAMIWSLTDSNEQRTRMLALIRKHIDTNGVVPGADGGEANYLDTIGALAQVIDCQRVLAADRKLEAADAALTKALGPAGDAVVDLVWLRALPEIEGALALGIGLGLALASGTGGAR